MKYAVVCYAVHDTCVLSCDLFPTKEAASEFLRKDLMEMYEASIEDDPDATITNYHNEDACVTSCDGELVWTWQICKVKGV